MVVTSVEDIIFLLQIKFLRLNKILMEGFKECKLCDNVISDGNFTVIGDATKNIFNLVLLKLTLHDDTQNVMCMACTSKLLATLSFKLTCLYMDNNVISYVNFEDKKTVDLKEMYVKGSKHETSILEDREVCRLCLQPTSSDHKSVEEMPVDSIQIYIPEIKFSVTTNPVICIKCHDALCVHSSFIKNCLDVEKKRNMTATDDEDILLTNSSIKTGEIEIKPEPVDDETLFEITYDIKDEKQDEGDTTLHSQKSSVGTEDTNSLHDLEDLKETNAANYECEGSIHLITSESRLTGYRGQHKRDGEVRVNKSESVRKDKPKTHQRMYECDECDYKSSRKHNLKSHQLRHKDRSQLQMFKCDRCDFETKHKGYIKEHQLIHKDPSGVQMHACEECQFVTKYKSSFRSHKLRHKNASEVLMYECDECDYKSKIKRYLTLHRRKHKDPSELPLLMCDECGYETFRKEDLRRHQSKHKDPSEVRKYTCDKCDFKSIRKYNLKRHQSFHKDPSVDLNKH